MEDWATLRMWWVVCGGKELCTSLRALILGDWGRKKRNLNLRGPELCFLLFVESVQHASGDCFTSVGTVPVVLSFQHSTGPAADTEPFINCLSCSEYCACIKTLYLHHSLVNCEVGPIIIRKLGV